MSNSVEFILRIRDLMSGAMSKATSSAQRDMNNTAQTVNALQRRIGDTRSIATMERALRMLERRVHLSVDTSDIATANAKISALRGKIKELRGLGTGQTSAAIPSAPSGGGGGGMLGSFVGGSLIGGAITEVVGVIKNQIVDTYQAGLRNSSLSTAINATTGGNGKQAIQMTDAISNKYGLNYEASLEGVKTLTGGLKSMNMTLAQQMAIYEGVSTGIAAMKLGAEESKGAMLALGQMASKGTVSAEELRGQLGERIPGAFSIAARAIGVTESKLNDMLQKGEIASKDFLPKFAAEMKKTFGEDALAAAKGPQAVQERFNNAIFKMKAGIGEGLMPVVTPILESFTTLATSIMPYIQTGIDWLVSAFASIREMTSGWSDYASTAKDTILGIWPAVKNIAGTLFGIIRGMIDWIGKSQIIRDVFSFLGWIMKGLWNVTSWVADKIGWLWENILKPILDGLEAAYGWVKDLVGSKSSMTVTHQMPNNNPLWLPMAKQPAATKGQPMVTTSLYQPQKMVPGGGVSDLSTKEATHSGPKQITVNINKEMIGKLEFITQNVKESAATIEDLVREAVLRTLYSLDGQ